MIERALQSELKRALADKRLSPEQRAILAEISRVDVDRDPSDPLQLKRDLRRVTDLLQRLYGEGAIERARQMVTLLDNRPFARLVLRRLERMERERTRPSSP